MIDSARHLPLAPPSLRKRNEGSRGGAEIAEVKRARQHYFTPMAPESSDPDRAERTISAPSAPPREPTFFFTPQQNPKPQSAPTHEAVLK